MTETRPTEIDFIGVLSLGYALRANLRAMDQLDALRVASERGEVDPKVYAKWEAKRPGVVDALTKSYSLYNALPETVRQDLAMAIGLTVPSIRIKSREFQE